MQEVLEQTAESLIFSSAAAAKVKSLIEDEGNADLKLRVFVSGGGCSGFQYGFTFDENVTEGDTIVETEGVKLLIDPMVSPSVTFSSKARVTGNVYYNLIEMVMGSEVNGNLMHSVTPQQEPKRISIETAEQDFSENSSVAE